MTFEIKYIDSVQKEDLPKLSKTAKNNIKKAIEKKLVNEPELYGKPLRRSLKGYRKLRVEDYRVIFRIHRKIVKIIIIQHRSVVYKHTSIRINE